MIPGMKRYRVLVGYIMVKGRKRQLFFDEVWATSKQDAWMQLDSLTLMCGEPYVQEIDE